MEVINSGSVFELDEDTRAFLKKLCREKQIGTLHFESHYCYRDRIPNLRREFEGFDLKMKLGLETFDFAFREHVLQKGIPEQSPEEIARGFEEANFLFGITGQTLASMERDIQLGLKHFERICINVMCENSTKIRPDRAVIEAFCTHYLRDEPVRLPLFWKIRLVLPVGGSDNFGQHRSGIADSCLRHGADPWKRAVCFYLSGNGYPVGMRGKKGGQQSRISRDFCVASVSGAFPELALLYSQ